MKIGLFFGSFNPIHNGHLIIASHILNEFDIQRVWFVVSPHNPFKETASLLNEHHRKFLVDLAIGDDERMYASNIEFSLPRPSYTIDTLVHLEERYPDHQFSVIMGSDSLRNVTRWKNGALLLKNYPIIVYTRPSFPVESLSADAQIQVAHAPLLDISSTLIRSLVKERKSIRYLMPDAVREEIMRAQYYF